MATRKDKGTARQASPQGTPRRTPKMKVIEMGREVQGERIPEGQASGPETVRELDRQEQHHGGTPIGSDPRE